MTPAAIRGSCPCGRFTLEVTPPPRFVAHCHCDNCRRAHGAAFVTWAGFPVPAAFRLTCDEANVTRHVTDTGATRSFCNTCGATLLYESPRWPDEVHVVLANLEGDVGMAPSAHVYADRAPAWCPILDDLPRHGGESGMEPLP